MKTYGTFEEVADMRECRKTATAEAKRIGVPFRVDTLEGDYKQGKAGDMLMRGVEGELYICDRDIFVKTYAWVEED